MKIKTMQECIDELYEDLDAEDFLYHFPDNMEIKTLCTSKTIKYDTDYDLGDEFLIFKSKPNRKKDGWIYTHLHCNCHPDQFQKAVDGKIKFIEGWDLKTAIKYSKLNGFDLRNT